jgi:hypothetical protein
MVDERHELLYGSAQAAREIHDRSKIAIAIADHTPLSSARSSVGAKILGFDRGKGPSLQTARSAMIP